MLQSILHRNGNHHQRIYRLEFVLLGVDDKEAVEKGKKFYASIHDKLCMNISIEEAEMIEVSSYLYHDEEICLANVIMEASHKLDNVNCDNG